MSPHPAANYPAASTYSIERYEHHHRRWIKLRLTDKRQADRHLYALRAHLRQLGWLAPEHDRPGLGVR